METHWNNTEVDTMPHRWPADIDYIVWELDVLDRDCASCGRMMHICDQRYRRFFTFEGPVKLVCGIEHTRAGIAANGHPAGTPGAGGVERLRPRENGQRLGGGEWGGTD